MSESEHDARNSRQAQYGNAEERHRDPSHQSHRLRTLWVLVKAEVVGVARFVLFSNVALGAALGIKMLAVRDARVCTSLGQQGGGNNGKEGSCFHVFKLTRRIWDFYPRTHVNLDWNAEFRNAESRFSQPLYQ